MGIIYMGDKEEAYYQYLLSSGIGEDRAKAHKEIVAEYFWKIFSGYGCRDVVDVGCGLGSFIEKAVQGINTTGIDSNSRVIEHCRKAGINAICGDAMNLPLDESVKVDGIMCAHVIEHLPDPEKAFREFRRVLSKGGVLVVRVPPFDSLFYDDWTHVKPFTRKTLGRLASATGFSVVRVFYYHYDLPFCSWKTPFFRFLNNVRHLPGIETIIASLIRASGFPSKEIVLIAKISGGD